MGRPSIGRKAGPAQPCSSNQSIQAMNAVTSPTASAGHQHWQQGLELAAGQRWREAARAFGRATRAEPQDAVYWLNLAHVQRRGGALKRAVAAARRTLQVNPREALALRVMGDCLLQMHRYAEAAEAFAHLEAMGQSDPEAMVQHASVLQSLHRHGEASAVLLRVLAMEPAHVRAHALLSDSCRDRGLKREAVECMKTVLALQPDNLEALSRASFEKRHLLDWSDLDSDMQRMTTLLAQTPDDALRVTAAFAMLSLPLPPQAQLKSARVEARALAAGAQPLPPLQPEDLAADRIRIGFVSYDFRDHPVSQLLVDVLEGMDRAQFDVHLYSSGPDDNSALRQRLQKMAHGFVDLRGLSDAQAAARIRADGVHLLVDLMGHTRGMRLGVFARRPAPVQVAYLGYPATTGADYIDYLIGDPLVTPLELAGDYTEKLAQMPLTMQPNGRGRPLPQPMSRQQAGLPEDAFVMCAFNHTYKILPEAFDAWCAVMKDVPRAVLWLKETNAQLHDNVRRAAAERGIDPARVIFAPGLSYADHFSRLALADVFVDTWPYNAHTTASDALWAGVPVVTLYGNSYASRVAASVLNAAGLAELAFATVADYTCAITALATDAELLAGYKQHLNQRRLALPLYDTARYTRELEALCTRMVGRWRQGLAPDHLAADHGLAC
jgi:predicted O-linked N-acetylglucosamine transferase (SPINDLY family)